MQTFVLLRHALTNPTTKVAELQTELNQLKAYIEEVFTDYNDINDDTRVQIELLVTESEGVFSKDTLTNHYCIPTKNEQINQELKLGLLKNSTIERVTLSQTLNNSLVNYRIFSAIINII